MRGLYERAERLLSRGASRRRGDAARAPAPRHKHVVVVTYGRSGSTLVQGLLNTMPRTLVRGESNLYVLHLFRAWDNVRQFRADHLDHNTKATHSAFFGLDGVKPKALVEATRSVVREHLLGGVDPATVDVLGFKEVTWHRLRPSETEDFFTFLERVLPGCHYVLNERDHEQLHGSGYWKASSREQVMRKVGRVEEIQDYLRRTRPERTLSTRYERITSDDAAVVDAELEALARFVLGQSSPELLDSLRRTLAVGHGPFPFGASRTPGPAASRARPARGTEPA